LALHFLLKINLVIGKLFFYIIANEYSTKSSQ